MGKNNRFHIDLAEPEKKLLDFLAQMTKFTKVDIIRKALLKYSETIMDEQVPGGAMMKDYLMRAHNQNKLLEQETYSMKAEIKNMSEIQKELIKAVNRGMDKI